MPRVFKAEYQPEAIALAIDQLPSPGPYLRRLHAEVRTELEAIDETARTGIPFVRQFCPARAAECYRALEAIQQAAAELDIVDLIVTVDWTMGS